jgi:hypothetical protein
MPTFPPAKGSLSSVLIGSFSIEAWNDAADFEFHAVARVVVMPPGPAATAAACATWPSPQSQIPGLGPPRSPHFGMPHRPAASRLKPATWAGCVC